MRKPILALAFFTLTLNAQEGPGPEPVDLQPRTGAGNTVTVTARWRHPGGPFLHYLGYILFLPTPNSVQFTALGTCLIEYNRISHGVRLIDNAGTGWIGPVSGEPIRPGAAVLDNNQCSVNVAGVVAGTSGDVMTVTAPVTLKNAIGTVLGTFTQSQDVAGRWTGMTQFGNWVVPSGTPQTAGPYVVSMSPASGAGSMMNATITWGHQSGNAKNSVDLVHLRFSPNIVTNDFCHIIYSPIANALNLVNDDGTALAGGWLTPNGGPFGAQTAENSRCIINRTGLPQSTFGTPQMTITFSVGFKPAFAGPKNTYMNVFDQAGMTTHWVQAGTWTVQ
jgi:hypothetical protein